MTDLSTQPQALAEFTLPLITVCGDDVPCTVYFDYTRADVPDYPANALIVSITANDSDVTALFSPEQRRDIERDLVELARRAA